jgi:BirA family biotin operon repressor/biotin-[acetyl-CoA-carboxylase] ligase
MIGLGLNIRVTESAMQEVEQAWVDLYTINQHLPERNVLAAALLTEIIDVIESFEMTGFNSFRQEWDSFDVLKNFEVELLTGAAGAGHIVGKVLGVDAHGALQLKTAKGIETFHGGEISPRMRMHANP